MTAFRMRRASTLLVLLVLAGCRDGVPPFTPVDRIVEGDAWALTFGSDDDSDPQWSASGDSVYYHSSAYPGTTRSRLWRIATSGSTASLMFPEIQSVQRFLVTPVPAPDGRFAYIDLMRIGIPQACGRADAGEPTCLSSQPVLDSAALRVREADRLGPIFSDVSHGFRFAGSDPLRAAGADGPWSEQYLPMQARFRIDTGILFRPSWSPNGNAVVFGDGTSLRTWDVGTANATMIPNTTDGVSPAWSPDGQWIAFTLIQRTDSQTFVCSCGSPTFPLDAVRTIYETDEPVIALIRPDGSDVTVIGPGEDPAWSPDGNHLYIRRDDRIVRIARDGSGELVIPHTERGRAPAVSPDGRHLAFSRRKPQEGIDYDIWVVRLQP